jgi:hypothetical protein
MVVDKTTSAFVAAFIFVGLLYCSTLVYLLCTIAIVLLLQSYCCCMFIAKLLTVASLWLTTVIIVCEHLRCC